MYPSSDTLSRIAQTVQAYSSVSLFHFIPELILGIGFLLAILIDAVTPRARTKNFTIIFAACVLAIAGIYSALEWRPFQTIPGHPWQPGSFIFPFSQTMFPPKVSGGEISNGYAMAVVDNFSIYFKLLVSISGILALLMSLTSRSLRAASKRFGEYSTLILGLSIGLYLLPASTDLIMMYLSLELSSIAGYVLAGFLRKTERGAEASLKYILFGALSSGIMIYGFSLLYGVTGSTNIIAIRQVIALNPLAHQSINIPILWAATLLILAGVGYKISAFPFHFWTPDVYEGAPIPIAGFLSVASKAAGFGMLIRLVVFLFPTSAKTNLPLIDWQTILAIGAIVTMTFGNIAALLQTNVRRMLAYSTIAHSGYMLAALASGNASGIVAVMIYLAVYLFMQLGAFYAVMIIEIKIGSEELGDYRGLMARTPGVSSALVIFLISLTGIPVTAGFIGKFYLITSVLSPHDLSAGSFGMWLAIAIVLNSIVSLYYYLRVAAAMFLKRPLGAAAIEAVSFSIPRIRTPYAVSALMMVFVIPVVLLGVYFQPLVDFASGVVRFFNFDNFRF